MAWFRQQGKYWFFVVRVGPPGAKKERKYYIGTDEAVIKRLSRGKRKKE